MFLTTEFAIENLSFYDDATALHELLTAPNVDLTRSEVQRVADGMLNVIRQNYLSRRCRYPVNLPQMYVDLKHVIYFFKKNFVFFFKKG